MESTNEQTTHKTRKTGWIITISLASLLLLVIIFLVWLYTGSFNQTKASVFKAVPLPAAAVESSFIPYQEVAKRLNSAEQAMGKDDFNKNIVSYQNQIFERLIADKQTRSQAKNAKISVTKQEVDEQYLRLVNQLTDGDQAKFETTIKDNYRLTLEEFKSEVVEPDLIQTKLQVWFNQQKNLNNETFSTSDIILKKLNAGEKFEELAKTYSNDETSKNLGGDAGTIALKDMLPEFQSALKDAKTGETKQISSRYGQHIVKVLEKDGDGDNTKIHLQQIFLKQDGFNAWYTTEIKNIKVFRFIKF